MVNHNPETVSTDYDMCDRLYFEELSSEVGRSFDMAVYSSIVLLLLLLLLLVGTCENVADYLELCVIWMEQPNKNEIYFSCFKEDVISFDQNLRGRTC